MILKINELELKNKIMEKQIWEQMNKKEKEEENKTELIKEKKDGEKEPLKEIIKEDKNEDEKNENDDNNIIEEIIEERPQRSNFVPHEIKERNVEELEWTVVKKGKKNKKPQ